VKAIVRPPAVSWFPAASFAVTVAVIFAPETTVPAETVTVDWASEKAPGVTVIVGRVDVTAEPPIVPLIVVALPARTPVKVAV
jgi:chorismate synthase